MKKFFSIFTVLVLALVTFGCSKKPDEPVVKEVKLNMTKSYLDVAASTFWVNIIGTGSWTLSLEFPSAGETPVEPWAEIIDQATGDGNGQRRVKYTRNDGEVGRELIIVLKGENGEEADRYAIMQRKDGRYEADPLPSWLELPEQSDAWVYHNQKYTYNGKTCRNFSYGWNAPLHLSNWVAYPLTKTPSGSRRDEWSFDNKVDVKDQANCVTGSYTGAYDRGHQIPSADRRVPLEAQDQTCLMTNLTPQKSNFNQGIWANFETQVRGWATKADTLYVVTGCEVSATPAYTTDRDGKQCPIPSHYYKVLLARGSSFNGIPAAGTKWLAAAFRLAHTNTYGKEETVTKDYMMSVSDFEKITGINFYVNLAALVGEDVAAAIEADDPSKRDFWF